MPFCRVVHQSYLSSEQYHLINYGIGGQIEVHVDYWGPGIVKSNLGDYIHIYLKKVYLRIVIS